MTATLRTASTTPPAPPPRPARDRRLGLAVFAAVGLLIAVATIGWTAYGALSFIARQRATTFADYDGIRSVTVEGDAVDVTITASSGGASQVERDLQWSFYRPTTSVTRDGDHLTIRTQCGTRLSWSCTVHVGLHVPAATSINVRSGSGDLTATGLTTGATLRTSDGNVTATSIRGDLQARTSAGNVTVTGSDGNVNAGTSDGNVTLTASRSDHVDATTSNGNVTVQLDASPTMVQATSDDGDVTVELPDEPGVAYAVNANSSVGTPNVSVRVDPFSLRQLTARTSYGDVKVRYG